MGLTRVFRRSVRFTFRSKRRFLVFLLIFAIVSTLIAFYVDELDTLQTDSLLEQKGITVQQRSNRNVSYPIGLQLYNQIVDYTEGEGNIALESSQMYSYVDVDSSLRIHSIDINDPWASSFAKPSLLVEGRYPEAPNEIMVPNSDIQKFDLQDGTYSLESQLSVGQTLTFVDSNNEKTSLEIVGLFDSDPYRLDNPNDQLWLFMDQSKFEELVPFFGLSLDSDAYVYSMTFVVEGRILVGNTYLNANKLNQQVRTFLEDSVYDNFEDIPDETLPLEKTRENANRVITTLGFVVIGGVILATLFAYLITRFRRREIAILKAMGYSHSAVRTSLLGELLTTSFIGFIFGLGLAQGILLYLNELDFNTVIRPQAVGISFIIMVIVALPGMLLTSRRVLSVSPAEAFRDN